MEDQRRDGDTITIDRMNAHAPAVEEACRRCWVCVDEVVPYLVGRTVARSRRSNANSSFARSSITLGTALSLPETSEFRSGAFATRFASTKT